MFNSDPVPHLCKLGGHLPIFLVFRTLSFLEILASDFFHVCFSFSSLTLYNLGLLLLCFQDCKLCLAPCMTLEWALSSQGSPIINVHN